VNVAPGYARNRLIPNMLALPAIDRFVIMVQNQIKVNLARSILVEWILS
jgi:ribosomal protein L9